jgi:hypothetical protein
MKEGDLLRLLGGVQFGQTSRGASVQCRLQMVVEGPGAMSSSSAQKSLTPNKSVLPLATFLTARATVSGVYRVSLRASGQSDQGAIPLPLDTANSQVQHLHFSLPG